MRIDNKKALTFTFSAKVHASKAYITNMDTNLIRLLSHLTLMCFLKGEPIVSEPVCTSMFDYEFKVLSKLVELETEQKRLQETVGAQQTAVSKLVEFETEQKRLQETVDTQQTRINELQQQIETKGL